MKTVSEESASAAELETQLDTPESLGEAMETGFLPDDEHYRLTGEFKKETATPAPEKKEAAAASTEKDESEINGASAASSSKAAASETASTQTQGRESRWQKRERELKDARAEIARLKSASSTQTEARSETQQTSQSAAEPRTQAAKTPKPKIDDVDPKTQKPLYKTFADYEDAKDAWLRQETIREFNETQARTQQQTAQQQEAQKISDHFTKQFAPLRAKYPDFDQVALSENLVIPKGSVTDLFMLDSEHAGEVAYYLGKHPEILQGFYRDHDPKTGKFTSLITPQRQFRKLMEIEAQVTGSRSGASGDDGRNSSSSSARPVTQASRPPHQVSGQGAVAKDSVEQALEDGDFETYQRTQNAKDLARLKKK